MEMNRTEPKWIVRAFRDGDEKGILDLWEAVYPERPYQVEQWTRWWQWMYRDNPCGRGKICLADYDGQIVGQYAITPMMLKIGDDVVPGSLSLDTMTHPEYRRQRIFETLATAVYDEARRGGTCIVYGFPNEFSYPGFISKLDWFYISTMRVAVKPLNWRNSLSMQIGNRFLCRLGAVAGGLAAKLFFRSTKTPVVEGLTISQAARFDERVDDLWARVSHRYQVAVVRSREYLNWRYTGLQDADYLIYVAEKRGAVSGYLVMRCAQMQQARAAIIFDVLAETDTIAQCLVARAVERSAQDNMDVVYWSSVGGRALAGAFRRNGFMSLPFLKSLRLCAYANSPSVSKELLQDSANWHVQMGDSDMM
jgi:GNAT superfamily N-acetyltransferase